MRVAPSVLLVTSVLFLAGCADTTPPVVASHHSWEDDLKNTHGITFADGRRGALSLYPGIPTSVVISLLGEPDTTLSGTYGQGLGEPWQGIEWIYGWGGWMNRKELHIVFQEGSKSWIVNNWRWIE